MASEQYRIEPVAGGWEAQMLYPCGAVDDDKWFPLRPDGYWSDPDAYSFGLIAIRHVFETREEAARAIAKARALNGTPPVGRGDA